MSSDFRRSLRNYMARFGIGAVCTAAIAMMGQPSFAQAFVHPGCLETAADFARMHTKVVQIGQSPWIDDWKILIANGHAQPGYVPHPQKYLVRGIGGAPCNVETYPAAMNDAAAAYQLSLRWRIDGDTACANTAVNILNAWSSTLEEVCGDPNAALNGIYGYEFACAAENMRGYGGWAPADFARFRAMLANKFYPMSHDFLQRHDGTCPSYMWANWDLIQMADEMAIGVVCDNRAFYDDAIKYWYHGVGNGRIDWDPKTNTGTVVAEFDHGTLGQGQEEGRDQGHSGLETSLEGVICTIAQNQGDNLFGYNKNKVESLCEYFADYNLGNDVPFANYANCQGNKMTQVSSDARGDNRPSWDLLYNQFVNRMNLPAPYTTRYAMRERPEGGGGDFGPNSGGFDQLGFTTLTNTIDKTPIASGNYKIVNVATGSALDNVGGRLFLRRASANENQQWAVKYLGNGYYRMTCATSDMCLDGFGRPVSGSTVGERICDSTGANQAWMIVPVGSEYKIVNETSGLCLDGAEKTGAVRQRQDSNAVVQLWRFVKASHGGEAPVITGLAGTFPYATASGEAGSAFKYAITATDSPRRYGAMGLPPGLHVNTSTGVIYGTPASSGVWLTHVFARSAGAVGTATLAITISGTRSHTIANGTYKIVNRSSGLSLEAVGQGTKNGTLIDQQRSSSLANQKWQVTSIGNGLYKIIGVQSGLALDLNIGTMGADLWNFGGGSNQEWDLSPSAHGYYYISPANLGPSFVLSVPEASVWQSPPTDVELDTGGKNQQWSLTVP